MNGVEQMIRWIKQIGVKNHVKLSRYEVWKKLGFCPSNSTYEQRIKILKGEVEPNILKGP